MIKPVTMYAAECDRCRADWEIEDLGWSCLDDEHSLRENLAESGWCIGDGSEGELDKTYCPNCWTYDDNDVFTLIDKPTTQL